MSKEKLDSDKVNYMIWRYLIELDYLETAVRLQKEWNIKDPQQLPFASHVQPHALVSILNRGLIYNMYERKFVTQEKFIALSEDVNAQKMANVGFFGPVTPISPIADDDFGAVRKHSIDHDLTPESIPPLSKKQRFTNGCDNTQAIEQISCNFNQPKFSNGSHKYNTDEGQINDKINEQAYPSPEQMPTPHAVAIPRGHEKGIQVEKVNDLSSETIYLELSDCPMIKGFIVTHCAFHPRDSNILAAAGSDALARIWSLKSLSTSKNSVIESPATPIYAPHRNLYDLSIPTTTQATALSWAPEGRYLAIASQPSEIGLARVDFWNEEASLVTSNFGIDAPVISIQWNPTGTACLIISPQNDATDVSIMVIYPTLEKVIRFTLPRHNLVEQLLEVVWTSNDDFIVCGGDLLQSFLCSAKTNSITQGKKYEVPDGATLSQVAYDIHTQLLATASDTGVINIWNKDGQSCVFTAHQGLITHLIWQPLTIEDTSKNIAERLLASAGEDGAISIWNVLPPDIKGRVSMTMKSAPSAMAFSPDGTFLAGATSENILIWRIDSPYFPQATWTRQHGSGWQTPLSSESTSSEEELCSLSWDSDGRRLAYGINNRLALINFRP